MGGYDVEGLAWFVIFLSLSVFMLIVLLQRTGPPLRGDWVPYTGDGTAAEEGDEIPLCYIEGQPCEIGEAP